MRPKCNLLCKNRNSVFLHELMTQLVRHSLYDTDKDDEKGGWVEGMVKSNDLQDLQLSCSIRRRGVKLEHVQVAEHQI